MQDFDVVKARAVVAVDKEAGPRVVLLQQAMEDLNEIHSAHALDFLFQIFVGNDSQVGSDFLAHIADSLEAETLQLFHAPVVVHFVSHLAPVLQQARHQPRPEFVDRLGDQTLDVVGIITHAQHPGDGVAEKDAIQ